MWACDALEIACITRIAILLFEGEGYMYADCFSAILIKVAEYFHPGTKMAARFESEQARTLQSSLCG